MRKIKKLQVGSYVPKRTSLVETYADKLASPAVKNFQAKLSQTIPTMNFDKNIFGYDKAMNVKITPPTFSGLGSNLFGKAGSTPAAGGNLASQGISKFMGGINKIGPQVVGEIPAAVETGMKMLGANEADTASGGEKVFQQATTVAFKGALKTGNPLAIGITGALKGLDMLNRYAGSTAEKQGTTGIDTGAYTTQISQGAGKKQTLLGSIG